MQDVALFLNLVETIGIISGTVIALLQIRRIQQRGETELETRQASLFMQIYDHFYNPEFLKRLLSLWDWRWSDYEDYLEKYAFDNNPDVGAVFISVVTYFEGIGVLVNRKLIAPGIVDDLISGLVIRTWEQFEDVIREDRERLNWPQYCEFFENLYREIKTIAESQHPEILEKQLFPAKQPI